MSGRIVKVSGPLIVAEGMKDVELYDVVRVSEKRLIGEVIELRDDKASIEVYEETAGLGPGEPVESTGSPLSVELAPGLIESIFDGIQRPLEVIYQSEGDRITRGIDVPKLNREKKWAFVPVAKVGDEVSGGDVRSRKPRPSFIRSWCRLVRAALWNGSLAVKLPLRNRSIN